MSLVPPPGIDLHADQGPRVMSSGVALIILPTGFVIVRFISRVIARAGFWWDDLLVVVSLILSYGPNTAMMVSARYNSFGKHLWALPDPRHNTSQFLKILYVYIIFYYAAVVSIKICILTFYRRIFPVTEIRLWLYIGYGLVGSYAVATLCSTTFQCQPIHGFWDKDVSSHCISGDNILVIPGSINAVLDAFVMALPLPLLWRLRTTYRQKVILTGIFACGGFVCIISVIRLIVLSRLEAIDVTWNYVNAAIWSAAEPAMGVIAACIPSLRPLAALIWRGTHRAPFVMSKSSQSAQAMNSNASSRVIWPVRGNQGETNPIGGFTRLEDTVSTANKDRWGRNVDVQGGNARGTTDGTKINLEEINDSHRVIRVKNEITIVSEEWDYKDRLY